MHPNGIARRTIRKQNPRTSINMKHTQQRQRRLFCITKSQMRGLLSIDGSTPLSETTFRRWSQKWQLYEVIGISEAEYRKRKIFFLYEYEKIKAFMQFNDEDFA